MSDRPLAVVTGASSGIGLATAQLLLSDGYDVVGIGRSLKRIDRALAGRVHGVDMDVSDPKAVATKFSDIGEKFGRIDALVNCAGVVNKALLTDMSQESLDYMIAANLMGTIQCTRSCIPYLIESGGSVVNLSSTLSARPVSGVSIYAATKAGIEGFTRAIAIEMAPHKVRVNAVAPAMVRSQIWLSAGLNETEYEKLIEARTGDYPLGRIGEPAEIASMIAFLLSDQAGWMTGVTINMDGGSSVRA